jgi:hypothetical protein
LREEEEIQRKRREDERNRVKDIMEYNEGYKRYMEEEKAIEREQDAILLDNALRKEKESITAEEMKKRASHEAARRYRAYLEEQMQKEKIDTAFVDEVRRREEEKVWKARDEALQAREDARTYLMQMVDQGRQEQLRLKQIELEREREEGKLFANRFLDDARVGVQMEQMEAERRRQVAIDNSQLLKSQIDERQRQRDAEKQETFLEDKQMKYMERLHRQRLAEQGGILRLNRPLQQSQWYS